MKANEYIVLSECVERGVDYGWMRALKHLDMPKEVMNWLDQHETIIKGNIDTAVTSKICEYFNFDEPKDE
jgi:hypothetical protein